jgi:type VI secretion system secreted protein Hcp
MAAGAVDYLLKIEGIDGESSDAKLAKHIHIDSWSMGVTNSVNVAETGGLSAGKSQHQDVHFTAKVGKHSPKLFLNVATGAHIKKAELFCRKAGGKEQGVFLKYTFTDCILSSHQVGGSGHGEALPVDQFSLSFAQVEVEYKEQKQDGSLGASTKAGYHVGKAASM